MAKDKKKIATAIAGITSALRKGYDLLNQEGQLPEVENDDLAGIGHHILKALKRDLDELSENVRFEGMTYEEILSKKEEEREAAIAQNVADANEAFRKMTQPEPVESVDEEESDGEPGGDEPDDSDTDTQGESEEV